MKNISRIVLVIALILVNFVLVVSAHAQAVIPSEAKISITFDDGFLSTYQNALPILDSRNFPATIYITTGFVDTGLTDDGRAVMTWEHVQNLQNIYGWEVGSHSATHPTLSTLTPAQIASDLQDSNAALSAHGVIPTNFATPYGDYSNNVLIEALKLYQTHRGYADRTTLNIFPYNNAVLQVQSVDSLSTVAQVQGWIDQAVTNKQWLILVVHEVQPTLDPNYEYVTTPADFTTIADYIVSKGIKVETVAQAAKIPGVNIITNSSFADGFSTNWLTDNPAQVVVDTNNNGSYAESSNSAKLIGSATSEHLFSSPLIAIPGTTFLLDAFYNTTGITSGELGFYMDEYDASNNWISGQWLGMVANNAVGFFNKIYTATSDLVSSLRVQTYLTGNSVGSVYIDNVKLYDLNGTITPTGTPSVTPSGTPSATPSPTPTPVIIATNLIQNPTFDSGITEGWTTDNATLVVLDTLNNGATPSAQNSVAMTGGVNSSHLFYGLLNIDPNSNYLFEAVVNATNVTSGELGFYIDEYDSTGTWVTGRWMGAVTDGVTSTFSRIFKAAATTISQIRIQTYLNKGSVGTAYVDNYALYNQSVTPTVTPILTIAPTATPTATLTPTTIPTITPTPTAVPPTPTPTPTVVNLVSNDSFEQLTAGWANSWDKTSNDYSIDIASNGDNGTNSLHLLANSASGWVYSQPIIVTFGQNYTWSQYLNALSGTGEFGFYIDEYDVAGNWISGQWKGETKTIFTGIKSYTYTPTSVNVNSIKLQFYAIAGSTFNLFVDSVKFIKQ